MGWIMGKRRQGMPHYNRVSWFGVGNDFQKPAVVLRWAAAQPLPWPSGPHLAGYK